MTRHQVYMHAISYLSNYGQFGCVSFYQQMSRYIYEC
jgi:hypothetical protein